MTKIQNDEMLISHALNKLNELCKKFQIRLPELYFDLKGKCAGKAYWPQNYIRINFDLLREHPEAFLNQIIPHELCHIWKAQLNLPGNPHDNHWKNLMHKMGAKATSTHNFATEHLITRHLIHYPYSCACREHEISSIRHNRIMAGREYRCRICGSKLRHKTNNP
ncbi:MAG: SprT-like domain-containing protein [Pseudomonadota bacterium]|nr:SprT-like domain-containing protein [Pseudomonadota bacterium]